MDRRVGGGGGGGGGYPEHATISTALSQRQKLQALNGSK